MPKNDGKGLNRGRSNFERTLKHPKIELWRSILLTVELIYDHLGKKLAEKNCTYPRFRLLFALYFDAPLSAVQLSRRLRVSRGNMSTFLKRLEKDGLIVGHSSESQTARLKYQLSEEGTRYFEGLMDFHFLNIKTLPLQLSKSARKEWLKLRSGLEKFFDS